MRTVGIMRQRSASTSTSGSVKHHTLRGHGRGGGRRGGMRRRRGERRGAARRADACAPPWYVPVPVPVFVSVSASVSASFSPPLLSLTLPLPLSLSLCCLCLSARLPVCLSHCLSARLSCPSREVKRGCSHTAPRDNRTPPSPLLLHPQPPSLRTPSRPPYNRARERKGGRGEGGAARDWVKGGREGGREVDR